MYFGFVDINDLRGIPRAQAILPLWTNLPLGVQFRPFNCQ
jgi:hypothetical protein